MKSAVLAGDQYLLADPVPGQVVDLEARLKEAVGSDFIQIKIIYWEKEQGPGCVGNYYNVTLSIAFHFRDAVLVDFEGFD
jgi:hypothetical protein